MEKKKLPSQEKYFFDNNPQIVDRRRIVNCNGEKKDKLFFRCSSRFTSVCLFCLSLSSLKQKWIISSAAVDRFSFQNGVLGNIIIGGAELHFVGNVVELRAP